MTNDNRFVNHQTPELVSVLHTFDVISLTTSHTMWTLLDTGGHKLVIRHPGHDIITHDDIHLAIHNTVQDTNTDRNSAYC